MGKRWHRTPRLKVRRELLKPWGDAPRGMAAARRRRIFLAHAKEDKLQVRKLYADLRVRDLDPWLDEVDLMPGQIWKVEIPQAIREADIFLACLSSRSVGKVGYVQNEFRQALAAFAERPPGSIWLIPVRLDDCEVPDLQIPDRGMSLRDIQWVDLWEEGGFDRLVTAIQMAPGSGHSTAVGPPPVVAVPRDAEAASASGAEPAPAASTSEPTILRPSTQHTVEAEDPLALGDQAVASPPETLRPGTIFRDIDASWCPEMVVVPPDELMMGSTEVEKERPQHWVQIAYPLAVGRYPVTSEEYDHFARIAGRAPPRDEGWGRGRRPAINVSWDDARAYVEWLSAATGQPYRLLSEAEWEHACRAGTATRYWWGDQITPKNANYGKNLRKTSQVGSYPANPFGLYGMQGNVWEWVEDRWHDNYEGAPHDGSAWTEGSDPRRVARGGSWGNSGKVLRSTVRVRYDTDERRPAVGFRVARTL